MGASASCEALRKRLQRLRAGDAAPKVAEDSLAQQHPPHSAEARDPPEASDPHCVPEITAEHSTRMGREMSKCSNYSTRSELQSRRRPQDAGRLTEDDEQQDATIVVEKIFSMVDNPEQEPVSPKRYRSRRQAGAAGEGGW